MRLLSLRSLIELTCVPPQSMPPLMKLEPSMSAWMKTIGQMLPPDLYLIAARSRPRAIAETTWTTTALTEIPGAMRFVRWQRPKITEETRIVRYTPFRDEEPKMSEQSSYTTPLKTLSSAIPIRNHSRITQTISIAGMSCLPGRSVRAEQEHRICYYQRQSRKETFFQYFVVELIDICLMEH